MKTHTSTSLSHYLGVDLPGDLPAVCLCSEVCIPFLLPLVIMVENFSCPGVFGADNLLILPIGVYGYS